MKKLSIILALLSIFTSAAYSNEKGNGGGGIVENGVYKTFYSAKIAISPERLSEADVPGSDLYVKIITSLIDDDRNATKFIYAGIPVGTRTFYRVLDEQMNDTLMKRLVDEYARVTGQPNEKLTIFAVTDTDQQITYLMPSFYKLTATEQAAILFHEAMWVLYPDSDYATIVEAELAFQEYAEKTRNRGFSLKLPRLLDRLVVNSHKERALMTALAIDAKEQNAPELIDQKSNVSFPLLYANFQYCNDPAFGSNPPYNTERIELYGTINNCTLNGGSVLHLRSLAKQFPKSVFIKELMDYIAENEYFTKSVVVHRRLSWEKSERKRKKAIEASLAVIRKEIESYKTEKKPLFNNTLY